MYAPWKKMFIERKKVTFTSK